MSAGRRAPRRGAGFTLVELLVSLTVVAVVMVALVQVLLRVEGAWDRSQDRVAVEQNTRGAVYMMVRDIRMAGSGFGGRAIVTGGVPGNQMFAVNPADGGTSDTLRILAGQEGVQSTVSQTMGTPGDLLFVTDASAFSAGDLIAVTNGVDVNMFEVTAIDVGSGQLQHSAVSSYNDPADHGDWPNGGYLAGSTVAKVEVIAYWLDTADPRRQLMRRVDEGTPIPVAWGVEQLQVMYRMLDGSLTGTPANPAEIHAVDFRYLPRRETGAAPTDTVTVTVQPRVLG